MTEQTVYQGLSKRARELLAGEETQIAEFKESISGLTNSDLVAFANSTTGGAILLGIREEDSKDGGAKIPVNIGHRINDDERLKILGKANSCIPPIQLTVIVENAAHKPFYRIEIPSSPERPHCTSGGTYKVRLDGANAALSPELMLEFFLDHEGDIFSQRFEDATSALEEEVNNATIMLKREIRRQFRNALQNLQTEFEDTLVERMQGLFASFNQLQKDVETMNTEIRTTIQTFHADGEDETTK